MDKQDLIKELQLQPLEMEGGYFNLTYTCPHKNDKGKPLMSSIFYLLTSDSPIDRLHKNCSDIMHYFHLGSPLDIITLHPDGTLQKVTLGPNILNGHKLQHLVPGGCWKTTILHQPCGKETDGMENLPNYGLISEAVAPGFEYNDRTMGTDEMIQTDFPQHYEKIKQYIYRQ